MPGTAVSCRRANQGRPLADVAKCGTVRSMDKPLVHVTVGIAFEQFVTAALDALIANGSYSEAMELHALLVDAASDECAIQEVLKRVEIHID